MRSPFRQGRRISLLMPAAIARLRSVFIRRRPIAEAVRRTAIFCVTLLSMAFQPRGPEVRCNAVGDLAGLPDILQRAFAPDAMEFDPIPSPAPNDWLAVHPEPGQTFDQFK